ncbi:MAG: DUF805 domain-containing protein [Sulfitobacter sp.]
MTKDWYYAVEGLSIGPINQEEFDAARAIGTVHRDTLVWQEGMDDWLPYGRMDTAGASVPPPPNAPMGRDYDPARDDANTFTGALKDGFARYVDFKSRSTRSQFWWWTLWVIIFGVVAGFLDVILGTAENGPIGMIVSLGMFLPSLAIAIRRLHDIGRSGWWYLIMLVPIVGFIVLLVFFCTRSQDTPNQWGPEPAP